MADTIKTLIGNIKGPKGDKGTTGATGATGPAGDKGDKGDTGATGAKGATGQRGSRWSQGTAITGTSTTATVFSSTGITDALVNDNYLNTTTGNTYRCTTPGNASTAKWVYTGCIKGATGPTGATGPAGPAGTSATTAEKVKYTKEDGSESTVQAELAQLNGNFDKSIKMKDVAGDLFDTTYGNGWYYFADKSINTPETYGICFVLKIHGWDFRFAIGTTKFAYTNVNIGQGFGAWLKL